MKSHLTLAAHLHDAGIPSLEAVHIANEAFYSGPIIKPKSIGEQRGSLLMQARVLRHRAEKIHANLHAQADAIEVVVDEHYAVDDVEVAS